MRKEEKLILEALRFLLYNLKTEDEKYKSLLIGRIDELLNPKSQEMPFKDTLKEKPKRRRPPKRWKI